MWPEAFYDLGIVKSRFFKRILDFVASISYRIPVAIIPISHGYVQTLITKYRIPQEKITVIEHGVDTRKFCIPKTNYSSSSSTIDNNLNNNDKNKKITSTTKTRTTTIMYSGNLNLGYDFETVIKSAKLLELQPVYFIIRGIGVLSDKVSQMVKEYDVKNVEVRTDLLSQEQLVSVLNSADIFLLPMNLDSSVAD